MFFIHLIGAWHVYVEEWSIPFAIEFALVTQMGLMAQLDL